MSEAVCRRCGDFLSAANEALRGFWLCRSCVGAERDAPAAVAVTPPASVVLKRLFVLLFYLGWIALTVWLYAAAAATVNTAAFGLGMLPVWILSITIPLILILPRLQRLGHETWKAAVVRRLAIDGAATLPFGLYSPAQIAPTAFRVPVDPALLGETDDGFVVLGVNARSVIRLADLADATIDTLRLANGHVAVRFDCRDGSARWFAFLGERIGQGDRQLAEECVARVKERLSALRGERRP